MQGALIGYLSQPPKHVILLIEMAENVFEKLVRRISPEERKDLLKQIGDNAAAPEEPLDAGDADSRTVDLDEVYKGLGLIAKIILFLKTLFSGHKRDSVLENELLAGIARDIQKRSSGIMDFGQRTFLPGFCDEIRMLKENVEPFTLPVNEAAGQRKSEFISFLASLYIEDLHDRIFQETDAYYQIGKAAHKGEFHFTHAEWDNRENIDIPPSSELSDAEVRRMMEGALEDILAAIPQRNKTLLYEDMKVFYHLINLSRFSFDKVISPFSSGPAAMPAPCPVARLKDQVVKLAEIMCNLRAFPSTLLLRALFLFCGADKADLESEAARRTGAAVRALQNIREMNKRVPWLLIARYIQRNINFRCIISGGAEDWFALLKQFWREKIDERYKDFIAKRREKELRRDVRLVFDPAPVREVNNYFFSVDGQDVRGTYTLSLSLIKTFLQCQFMAGMSNILKSILIDGVFYKEDNRREFTDGYNAIIKVSGMLESFEARLAPNGDIYASIESNKREYAPALIKRRKLLSIVRETDMDAAYLLQIAQGGLISVSKVLNGIIYGEIGGKYDTLSNLPEMGGKANAEFRRAMDDALRKINTVNSLLQKLIMSEKSWQENRETIESHD